MKSYQAATPRAVIMIAAAAMTVLTLGLSVLPASVNSGGNLESLANASRATAPAESAASGQGMPIVVYGVRQPETAMQKVHVPHVVPPQKQQS